jgi:hypothetical protein
MTNKPKFLRFYGALELRVEQIGPNEWGGSVCTGTFLIQNPGDNPQCGYNWDPFTALTEVAAKDGALATAAHSIGTAPNGSDKEWRDLSDIPNDDWSKTFRDRGFPGYPKREGMERWPGF